ncbi:MAG: HD domain-containing protein [Actinomycetota bacterium]
MDHDHELHRFGGATWLDRTGGRLTWGDRLRLLGPLLAGQRQFAQSTVALRLGRRRSEPLASPTPPRSAMARAAEDAAAEQPEVLVGHSYRTWAYGRTLAALDGVTGLDEELFYVASLLHDLGLVKAVTGEDFTLRGANRAGEIVRAHHDGDPERGDAEAAVACARQAVVAHVTPGITAADDGLEGFYVQAGATCDLVGIRRHHVPATFDAELRARHSHAGLVDDLTSRIRAEARAVRGGRFDYLRRTGFTLAMRLGPH